MPGWSVCIPVGSLILQPCTLGLTNYCSILHASEPVFPCVAAFPCALTKGLAVCSAQGYLWSSEALAARGSITAPFLSPHPT